MARYIDADALLARLPDDLPYKASVKRVLTQANTADVVPRSEVEVWKQNRFNLFQRLELYKMTRQKVAREIFEEIENVIDNELQNNYKVLPQFEFSNELWNKMSGRIEALKEICDFIAELKKKYTEGEV